MQGITNSVTSSEFSELYYTKNETDTLLNGKADVATTLSGYGITDGANTALSNLSAAGQIIIDSQNGTISNCVLEIPQNIKLTLENNVLTLKSGSILTWGGSTYVTSTTTSDKTWTPTSSEYNKTGLIFSARINGAIQGLKDFNKILSGSTAQRPAWSISQRDNVYYDVDTKTFYYATASEWIDWAVAYPLCAVEVDSEGNVSFAKDSNGNDMIFNGAGFVGHHTFIYPNVKVLIPNGIDTNGKMKSTSYISNSLIIQELSNYNSPTSCITIPAGDRWAAYKEVDTYEDFLNQYPTSMSNTRFYVKNLNQTFLYTGSTIITQGRIAGANYQMSGTTVTDFAIRQPYQDARNLLTDDLYKQIGDVETLLATV